MGFTNTERPRPARHTTGLPLFHICSENTDRDFRVYPSNETLKTGIFALDGLLAVFKMSHKILFPSRKLSAGQSKDSNGQIDAGVHMSHSQICVLIFFRVLPAFH